MDGKIRPTRWFTSWLLSTLYSTLSSKNSIYLRLGFSRFRQELVLPRACPHLQTVPGISVTMGPLPGPITCCQAARMIAGVSARKVTQIRGSNHLMMKMKIHAAPSCSNSHAYRVSQVSPPGSRTSSTFLIKSIELSAKVEASRHALSAEPKPHANNSLFNRKTIDFNVLSTAFLQCKGDPFASYSRNQRMPAE